MRPPLRHAHDAAWHRHRGESDGDKPDVTADYEAEGNLVSLEVLDASRCIPDPRHMDFENAA
jgi:hypothetical protein